MSGTRLPSQTNEKEVSFDSRNFVEPRRTTESLGYVWVVEENETGGSNLPPVTPTHASINADFIGKKPLDSEESLERLPNLELKEFMPPLIQRMHDLMVDPHGEQTKDSFNYSRNLDLSWVPPENDTLPPKNQEKEERRNSKEKKQITAVVPYVEKPTGIGPPYFQQSIGPSKLSGEEDSQKPSSGDRSNLESPRSPDRGYKDPTDASYPYNRRPPGAGPPYFQRSASTEDPFFKKNENADDPYFQKRKDVGPPYFHKPIDPKDPHYPKSVSFEDPYSKKKEGVNDPYFQKSASIDDPYYRKPPSPDDPYFLKRTGGDNPFSPKPKSPDDPYYLKRTGSNDPYFQNLRGYQQPPIMKNGAYDPSAPGAGPNASTAHNTPLNYPYLPETVRISDLLRPSVSEVDNIEPKPLEVSPFLKMRGAGIAELVSAGSTENVQRPTGAGPPYFQKPVGPYNPPPQKPKGSEPPLNPQSYNDKQFQYPTYKTYRPLRRDDSPPKLDPNAQKYPFLKNYIRDKIDDLEGRLKSVENNLDTSVEHRDDLVIRLYEMELVALCEKISKEDFPTERDVARLEFLTDELKKGIKTVETKRNK